MIRWSVNVATKKAPDAFYGRHYCRIELPPELNQEAAIRRTSEIAEKFGPEFRVDLTSWEETGSIVWRGYEVDKYGH